MNHTYSTTDPAARLHLFDEFAAQRDIGPAEDVGHVPGDAQVILLIRLWHLWPKPKMPVGHFVAQPSKMLKTMIMYQVELFA